MHLPALNAPDLIIRLWCGEFDCDKNDDKKNWPWFALKGDMWKEHSKQVANATPYLPCSSDCPPRNPAEKINSGYKAWEFLMYLFGLSPGLFYNVLPEVYWKNFCKLIFGIWILYQKSITPAKLTSAHHSILQYTQEFEEFCIINRIPYVSTLCDHVISVQRLFEWDLAFVPHSGQWSRQSET